MAFMAFIAFMVFMDLAPGFFMTAFMAFMAFIVFIGSAMAGAGRGARKGQRTTTVLDALS
eukprot:CAMPEP_0204532160 /NCGR_PEP_ID=MMETSP0661-20131031/11573_1 /ASSEMBLY_ACC=CAM_ASM_000606 /TAXON_ID=109239 /ORGANISM="Alexandrium margalefi, Strain AMGDE01CS-322" /LENGTH=59 /DNA_ID=CAMNT_0051538379 /DNA_START=335 /DNA_END=514 /DNA_ORIENTATION=+